MRSTSEDIDAPVILLNAVINSNVFIVNGRGNNHKLLSTNATILATGQKKLGCMFLLVLTKIIFSFKKNKIRCWKIVQNHSTFSKLGKAFRVSSIW